MKLRARLEKLGKIVAAQPPPGLLTMLVVVSDTSCFADDPTPGLHVVGTHGTFVYPAGGTYDPAEVEEIRRTRLAPSGMFTTTHVPRPGVRR